MKKIFRIFSLVVLICLLLWSIKQANAPMPQKETRLLMGTYVTISAFGPKEIVAKAINFSFIRLQEINVKFNPRNPESPVYAFNKKNVPISDPEIISLTKKALEISRESDGAFDITVTPLSELWGFYTNSFRVPENKEIKDCLDYIGYQHLLFKNEIPPSPPFPKGGTGGFLSEKLYKDNPKVEIDFGGIAKGYALAEAARVLKGNGVTSALIDVGGDCFALGKKSGKPWKVGIKNPRSEGIFGYIEAEDLAVASSGDYERFFIKDGKRYHHIFNSKTGRPAEGVISVTVTHPDPVIAQAWAKIPFMVGSERGIQELEKIKDMKAIVISVSGQILYSKDKLKIKK